MIPNDFPPRAVVYQQVQRWIRAGVFEEMVNDPRELLRVASGRTGRPTTVVMESRTLLSAPQSGHRAGCDVAKRTKGLKIQIAVDTLGHLLALHVTPADRQNRTQANRTAKAVQRVTRRNIELTHMDQGYPGEQAEQDADDHGISSRLVKLPQAKGRFVLLPPRWMVERSLAWMARFSWLSNDLKRLPKTVEGLHPAVFASIMLARYFAERTQHALG